MTPFSPPSAAAGGVAVGFYGKLPARGDFVRAGLPRDFTDRWDDWLQSVIAGSRAMMGDDWLPAFLEAPVWRFALPPGMCGERAALGLMLPSVDKAGRYFPLTFAALRDAAFAASGSDPWLDVCETAGRDALEQDTPPQEIAARLGAPDIAIATNGADGVWWSDGSPRVRAGCMTLHGMPDAATYSAMLGAGVSGTGETSDDSGKEASGETTWKSKS